MSLEVKIEMEMKQAAKDLKETDLAVKTRRRLVLI